MAIAGNEDDAIDLLRHEPLRQTLLLLRKLVQAFEAADAIPELASAGDDLDSRTRRDQRLFQPFELRGAEHGLFGHVRIVIRKAVIAIVEQEELDVAQSRPAERAGNSGQAVTGIRPVALKKLQRFAFERIRSVRIV